MWDHAVAVESLSKVYRVYATPWERVRELIVRRPRHVEFRALDGVSFALRRGESLAVVGENGAGKSTLLKILAGITAPTAGEVEVRGKIASILELGSAFHPEFTGRQNISLNAALLGLSAEEIRERTPQIVAWSELGDFIDQPVKCYSTGMAMRLGFSIATQVEPDVLIVDEALSVGDGYFQKKCMDRMGRFVEAGGTLLFCSHAMYYVSAFCQRALWLKKGRTEALGAVHDVVRDYEGFLVAKAAPPGEAPVPPAGERAAGPARLTGARLTKGEASPRYRQGEPWVLEIGWEASDPALAFHVGVGVNRMDEVEVFSFATHLDGLPARSGALRYSARLLVPELPLIKGEFKLYVFLLDEEGLHIYDQRVIPRAFGVDSEAYSFGLVAVAHAWDLDARPSSSVDRSEAQARR